jgi:small-conductance mechanosensitive channel
VLRRVAPLAPLLALALLLAPALVAAQATAGTAPVLVERVDAGHLQADVGQNASAVFQLYSLNPTDDFYVSTVVQGPDGWSTTVQPNRFFLPPRQPTNVTVAFSPSGSPTGDQAFEVTFSLVHATDGVVTKVAEDVVVGSSAPPRVLGLFANPLAPPLDNEYGTFLLDALLWTLIAVASILVSHAAIRSATAHASGTVTREILTKLRRPIFFLVFLFGLGESAKVLPPDPLLDFVRRFALAVAIGVFGLYVLYKVLDSFLYYYQIEIAPRTETKLDDVLVPVLRKVGVVVLYGAGIVYALRILGWDPTIIFAGAGIAGLVIAFAAQDTFSNLFSGIFLMLDRPFVEGDDIMLETGESARVENVGLRTTRLYNVSTHEVVHVPNNQLATRRIVNHSGPDRRYWVTVAVGASYDADPERVRTILLRVAKANPLVLQEAGWEPKVRFEDFGDSALAFQLRFGVKEFRDRFEVASQLRFAIKKAFDAEGIEIPYPTRTVHVRAPATATLPIAGPEASAREAE